MDTELCTNDVGRKAKFSRSAKTQTCHPTEILQSQLLANQISDDSDEDGLAKRIATLWVSDRHRHREVTRNREEMVLLRVELGKNLSRYKKILACTGRGGMWTAFLREHDIPRATADRYVQRWEDSQNPTSNRLSEAISLPTPDQIAVMARKTGKKLSTVLVTKESKAQFLEALKRVLNESGRYNPDYLECT